MATQRLDRTHAMYTAGWKLAGSGCDFSALGLTVGRTGCAGSRAASIEDRTFSSDMIMTVVSERLNERGRRGWVERLLEEECWRSRGSRESLQGEDWRAWLTSPPERGQDASTVAVGRSVEQQRWACNALCVCAHNMWGNKSAKGQRAKGVGG